MSKSESAQDQQASETGAGTHTQRAFGTRELLIFGFRLCLMMSLFGFIVLTAGIVFPFARQLLGFLPVIGLSVESVSISGFPDFGFTPTSTLVLIACMTGGTVALLISIRLARRRNRSRHQG